MATDAERTVMGDLSPAKVRVLKALRDAGLEGLTGRGLALALWPDSEAWKNRTRSGVMAGTMPMLGARAGRECAALGLVTIQYSSHWQPTFHISAEGKSYLDTLGSTH